MAHSEFDGDCQGHVGSAMLDTGALRSPRWVEDFEPLRLHDIYSELLFMPELTGKQTQSQTFS